MSIHHDEAELATLGAVLLDLNALSIIARLVKTEDFYSPAHQHIYRALLELHNCYPNIHPDFIEMKLIEILKSYGTLDLCGGAHYITRITEAVPTNANPEYYARIVKAASIRRKLVELSQEMIECANDDTIAIKDSIERAKERIGGLGEQAE